MGEGRLGSFPFLPSFSSAITQMRLQDMQLLTLIMYIYIYIIILVNITHINIKPQKRRRRKKKGNVSNFFLLCGPKREISLFIGGDSVPFRPGHGRVHQSPRIDEDTAEQWPCCGPINSLRLWHFCLTLASGNENYSTAPLLSLTLSLSLQGKMFLPLQRLFTV